MKIAISIFLCDSTCIAFNIKDGFKINENKWNNFRNIGVNEFILQKTTTIEFLTKNYDWFEEEFDFDFDWNFSHRSMNISIFFNWHRAPLHYIHFVYFFPNLQCILTKHNEQLTEQIPCQILDSIHNYLALAQINLNFLHSFALQKSTDFFCLS